MAQAASNVVDLWTKFYADGGNIGSMIPALEELTAPDVKYQVVGQPGQFALATTLEGKDAMMKYVATVLAPAFLGILNHTKPVVHESMALIGDPAKNRYALEVKETGTTLDGAPFEMDVVFIFKTNESGKFTEIRLFLDTLNVQKAMETE